ncbi:catenin (Cadherin-associated protein), alpha 3 [Elysia marginata]|uniref:Catenin (Cadherin-associated protein), alpha 3 n=1 Tax=Elysia marginata TaxID=1093978 RepID=A0AAV4HW53_9GAST|nr:catenin (Cadherin-associated protein), alpha 3 [Elysia marginata]
MATEEITEFNIDNEKVEIVNDFIFLGSKIQNTGTGDGEIARRLALGRAAMSGLTKIWRSKDIGTKTKIRIFKLSLSHDGSGKGAALTAAVSLRLRNLKLKAGGESGRNLPDQAISVNA